MGWAAKEMHLCVSEELNYVPQILLADLVLWKKGKQNLYITATIAPCKATAASIPLLMASPVSGRATVIAAFPVPSYSLCAGCYESC